MMSIVVVILVTALILFYVRTSRNRRLNWLRRLQLVGTWKGKKGQILRLSGRLDKGTFEWLQEETRHSGTWRLVGHTLFLRETGLEEPYDVRLFQPGSIGLTDAKGVGQVFEKENDNVIAFGRKE